MTEIKISWEGPFNIEDILSGKIDSNKYETKVNDIGLYQIYGTHPIYGDNVLVYIGRTKNKNGFKSRLKNRWVVEDGSDSDNVQIYLGTIFSDSEKLDKDEIIKDKLIDKAEVLLINALKPAFNSSNIQSVDTSLTKDRYLVHNTGNHRRAPTTLDSEYFWKEYKNFSVINDLQGDCKIDDEENYYGYIIDQTDKYDIWLCVDYEIWNMKKVPLTFQIDFKNNKELKKANSLNEFEIYKYIGEDDTEEFLYKDASDLIGLTNDKLKEEVDKKINEIKNKLKN